MADSPGKSTIQLYNAPMKHQLKLIYQNAETQNILTTEAIRLCQSLGIDYKELLPRPEVIKDGLDNTPNKNQSIKQRQHEIKRARRIIQISKIIEDARQNDGVSMNKSKIQYLSMTTEERVLKTKYGANYESVGIKGNNKTLYDSPQIKGKAQSRTAKNELQDPSMFYGNSYANQTNQSLGRQIRSGRSTDMPLSSPQLIYQRQELKKIRWNDILTNKEKNIADRHKVMKDQFFKKTKLEKEKAKKARDQIEINQHKILQKHEKYNVVDQRRRLVQGDLSKKMDEYGRKVQQKLDLAVINRQQILNDYITNKNKSLRQVESRGDLDDNSQFPRATKSAHAIRRGDHTDYLGEQSQQEDEVVNLLQSEYEKKMALAEERRFNKYNNDYKKQDKYHMQLQQTLANKAEHLEKRELDTMNKVILKHHKKEQKLRKDKKDKKELRDYESEKKSEEANQYTNKLKNLQKERQMRAQMLAKKHHMLDNRAIQMKQSLNNYCSAIKESNMFRQLDHTENMQKVKRAQSAYKRHLAAKIQEKGNRGRDISERQKKLSELAKTTSHQIGQQYMQVINNCTEQDRNNKFDLNLRNIYIDVTKKR